MTTVQLRDVHSQNLESGGVDGRPVVILLHGYGSNESDLTGLVPPLEIESAWASLRAPIELGNGGAAWFTIVTPGDPDAEPVNASTDAIWSWIDTNVSPTATVIPIGFSQGGLMASQLLRSRPERVRATVILGGFVLGAAQPADESFIAGQPPVFWGRGDQDRVITAAAVERTAEFLPKHSALVERIYPGLAHGISAEELADVRAFLTANGL
jgi:phospholipase/carboxylesterase